MTIWVVGSLLVFVLVRVLGGEVCPLKCCVDYNCASLPFFLGHIFTDTWCHRVLSVAIGNNGTHCLNPPIPALDVIFHKGEEHILHSLPT